MLAPILLAFAAIGVRLGLFAAGVPLPGFTFGFILMGLVTLMAFVSGALLLREEPNAPMPSLFRVALRDTAIFSLLCAAGLVSGLMLFASNSSNCSSVAFSSTVMPNLFSRARILDLSISLPLVVGGLPPGLTPPANARIACRSSGLKL